MKRKAITYILKAIIYVIMALLSYLGLSSFVGCSTKNNVIMQGRGKGTIHFVDTFDIYHYNDAQFRLGK